MLSVFIMYSTDRPTVLDYTIDNLKRMTYYDKCQKTLIVDGKLKNIPKDWEMIEVPRINNKFCWGRMWDAGVAVARHNNILYLDCDRLLPENYLEMILDHLKDNVFVFTSLHYMLLRMLSKEQCWHLLHDIFQEGALLKKEYLGAVRFEPRFKEPLHGAGKNVMSGSTAFTKQTYFSVGGVDPWYCGHGAFADTDFHYQSAKAGCEFIDLKIPELHLPHDKLGEDSLPLDQITLWRLSLDNFIYYCCKWQLSPLLAESMATRIGILKAEQYIQKKTIEYNKLLQ